MFVYIKRIEILQKRCEDMSKSLVKGLEVLKLLSTRKSMGLTEVSKELELNKSTTHRILRTLKEHSVVLQDKTTSKYRLGPAILLLSEPLINSMDIIRMAKPYMEKLVKKTTLCCYLCMLSNAEVVVIEQVPNNVRLKRVRVGINEPLHASSAGKCLVAFCDNDTREVLMQRCEFVTYTKNTVKNINEYQLEIDSVYRKGYALDNCEVDYDIRSVSVPIYDIDGKVRYSIGVLGNADIMSNAKIEKLIQKLESITKILLHEL